MNRDTDWYPPLGILLPRQTSYLPLDDLWVVEASPARGPLLKVSFDHTWRRASRGEGRHWRTLVSS